MKKFILLAKSRTGSSLLIDCIKQHPELNVFNEIFNYNSASVDNEIFGFNPEFNSKTLRFLESSHDRICTKENCRRAHEKYDGFKLLFCHLKNDVEEYLPEAKIILLHRRNLLERFVSEQVATMTNKWGYSEAYIGQIVINLSELEKNIKNTKNLYKKLDYLDTTKVFYEDGVFDNVNKICDALEIDRFTPNIKSKKRINRPMSEVIYNYDEVKHLDHTSHF